MIVCDRCGRKIDGDNIINVRCSAKKENICMDCYDFDRDIICLG